MSNSILSLVVPLSLCASHVSRSSSTIGGSTESKVCVEGLGWLCCISAFYTHFLAPEKHFSPVLLAMRCVMQWASNQHQLPELLTMLQLVYWTFRPLFNSKCIILSLMSWFFMKFSLFCLFWDALS